jgi:hypothetical protein
MSHHQYTNHQRIDNADMPRRHSSQPQKLPQTALTPQQSSFPSAPQVVISKPISSAQPPTPTHKSKPSISKQAPVTKPPAMQDGPKIYYETLLLALSDEYIDAAYKLGPQIAGSDAADPEVWETYHDLITAGLSCLEATLRVSFSFRIKELT